MSFTVRSEVGQLRQVIVHPPGLELSRLTPQNIGGLLFDDAMWAKRAKGEHDVFAESLRERGVTVHGSPQSVVFDQAANRMPTIKAVMVTTLGTPA